MFVTKESSSSITTSWHPMQTAKSEDMWELPHPSRPFEEDYDGDDSMTQDDTSPYISYCSSMTSTSENNNNLHHNENHDYDSSNTVNTSSSTTQEATAVLFGHPIQTAKSEDMWELPYPSRPFEEDDGDENMSQDTSPYKSHSWYFTSPRENNNNLHYNEDPDDDSSNTIINTTSRTTQKPTAVFGDATNTAPVLNVRRSRFA
jgi:hypothetical protein